MLGLSLPLVSATLCLGVIFRGKLYLYLCIQHLSLQFSFHWLFDFKAIHIPSQSVLKIGFLTKNGTGITHLPATFSSHTIWPHLRLEECAAVIIHNYVLLWAGFETLPSFGSSHCFFFHVLIQFGGLSPFTSLGHTSLQDYTDNPTKWEKHTGDRAVPLLPPCNWGQSAVLNWRARCSYLHSGRNNLLLEAAASFGFIWQPLCSSCSSVTSTEARRLSRWEVRSSCSVLPDTERFCEVSLLLNAPGHLRLWEVGHTSSQI